MEEDTCLSGQRLSKDHSLTNPQGVKKPKKITAPITKLFGRVSRKILCSHLKTFAYSVFRHYLTFKQDGQQQTLKWIKKYPIYTIKHTAGCCGIMDSIKYQQIKHQNLTVSTRNLQMGHCWIFHQDNEPKQISKSIQKWVTEHKIEVLPWPFQSPDHNPN